MPHLIENLMTVKPEQLLQRFIAIRNFTTTLCETLSAEDCCLQSMPDASPVRWHLAHTSWFFETFLLKHDPAYRPFDDHYEVLFNSYYNAVGEQFPRPQRGLLSRPSLAEVFAYREHVDRCVVDWIENGRIDAEGKWAEGEQAQVVELGMHHEQQHQELILTDVKHLFSLNPLKPTFREGSGTDDVDSTTARPEADAGSRANQWIEFDEGVHEIGHNGDQFAYDNEGPRHRVLLEPFEIAKRPITSRQFLDFVQDGSYSRPELWLSLGWETINRFQWKHPLYWFQKDEAWHELTLAGPRPLDLKAPVCHVSYFEADAFARWIGARLPTEAQWEVAAEDIPLVGNFADTLLADGRALHPSCSQANTAGPSQMFGDVWEWTASPYTAYPGYQAASGALGEYNGKFMCNQYVLRGGSVGTSSSHIRHTYRNFFPPQARWQFSGFRLVK